MTDPILCMCRDKDCDAEGLRFAVALLGHKADVAASRSASPMDDQELRRAVMHHDAAQIQCSARQALASSDEGFVSIPATSLAVGTTILDNENLPLIIHEIAHTKDGMAATMRYEFASLMVSRPGPIKALLPTNCIVRVTAIPAASRL